MRIDTTARYDFVPQTVAFHISYNCSHLEPPKFFSQLTSRKVSNLDVEKSTDHDLNITMLLEVSLAFFIRYSQ